MAGRNGHPAIFRNETDRETRNSNGIIAEYCLDAQKRGNRLKVQAKNAWVFSFEKFQEKPGG